MTLKGTEFSAILPLLAMRLLVLTGFCSLSTLLLLVHLGYILILTLKNQIWDLSNISEGVLTQSISW